MDWRALVLALVVPLAGCATVGAESERVRSALIGLQLRQLRSCLPVPVETDIAGPAEQLVYSWRPEFREIEPRAGRESSLQPMRDPVCRVTVESMEGHITSVSSWGRSSLGLNIDPWCMRKLDRCV